MRCFCPPDSWRGMRSAKARGSFTRSSSSQHGLASLGAGLADPEPLERAHDLRADRIARIERVERILEHHLDRGDRLDRAMLDRPVLDRLVAEHHEPLARRLESEQHLGEGRLAAAQFADDRQNLRFARGEGNVLVGLDRAGLAVRRTARSRRPGSTSSAGRPRGCRRRCGPARAVPPSAPRPPSRSPRRGGSGSGGPGGPRHRASAHRRGRTGRTRNACSAARSCSPAAARAAAAAGRESGSADCRSCSCPATAIERNRPCV